MASPWTSTVVEHREGRARARYMTNKNRPSVVAPARGLNVLPLRLDQTFHNQGGANGTLPIARSCRVRPGMPPALRSLPAERSAALGKRPGPRDAALPLVREPIRVDQD